MTLTLTMQILLVFGIGMVIYAVFGIFVSAKPGIGPKKKNENLPLPFEHPSEDPGKEQKIQRLQNHVVELEGQLKKIEAEYVEEESVLMKAKENESKLSEELKRRDEWVAKAEAELAKIKLENSDLNNKFIAKEKELEAEFANNVNLTRAVNEIKSALAEKEMGSRLKEDQIQAQKHQIEDQLKTIKEYLATIAEFSKKEKISEWVPKAEFNKLNEEYSQLENELEASQERLKSFAEEIGHLRQELHKNTPPVEKIKQEEAKAIVEVAKPEEAKLEEIKPEQATPEETKPAQPKPEEIKSEEVRQEETKLKEDKALLDNLNNIEKTEEKIKEKKKSPEEEKGE